MGVVSATQPQAMALITVAGTLAYLGLAVLGLGFAPLLLPPGSCCPRDRILRTVWCRALQCRQSQPLRARGSCQSLVIVAFGLIGLLAAYTDRKGFWTLDGDTVRWLGVVLFAHRWRVADLARLGARAPLQRVGGYPARA